MNDPINEKPITHHAAPLQAAPLERNDTMAEGNGTTYAADITDLGDKIAALTITKAVQLKDYLKEKYKIEPAGGVAVAAAPSQAAVAPVAEAKTEFDVILDGVATPDKKIAVIKVVREITSLGLKEAKEVVDSAPKPLKEKIPQAEADAIKKKIEEAGGKVTIK